MYSLPLLLNANPFGKCKCGKDCPNRIIQRDPQYKLELFKTNGMGVGVRAGEDILEGAYICHYTGEVITNEEAEKRGINYDKEHCSYLFDLEPMGDANKEVETKYVIDAMYYGNITRFFNHSCDPNMQKNKVTFAPVSHSLLSYMFFFF